jgi:hypothetical protein
MKTLSKLTSVLTCIVSLSANADDFRVVTLGGSSPSDLPWSRLITTQYDWETLARESYAADDVGPVVFCDQVPTSIDCVEPPPVVDFDTEQVIVGGLGLQGDSRHILAVSNVVARQSSGYQYVNIMHLVAGAGCTTVPEVSNPMLAVVVQKTELPIKLSLFSTTTDCEFHNIDLQ